MNSLPRVEGTLRDGLYIKSLPSCYSPAQLSRYLTRIGFAPKDQVGEDVISKGQFPATLDNLERLMRLHLLAFPFESTTIHYDPEHTMELDPQKLYHRLVNEGKGSYCFGQNQFFLYVLRGLGYRGYNVVGRTNENRDRSTLQYGTYSHILILVQPTPDNNITYVVDAGFGSGPVRPILLSDSEKSVVTGSTSTERFRIIREADLRSSLESRNGSRYSSHQSWIMQVQRDKSDATDSFLRRWITLYSFTEDEFYEPDIAASSIGITQGYIVGGLFRNHVFVSKFFLLSQEGMPILDPDRIADELKNADILGRDFGRVTLLGKELKYICGRKSDTTEIKAESERIRVLRDVFGIVISEDGKQCINGLPSALEDRCDLSSTRL